MKKMLSRVKADAAAVAILSQEPRYANSWLGRTSRILQVSPLNTGLWNEVAIREMAEPSIASPGSPYWGVFHRE